jgi:HAD superfamily hydrolase (TIGR01509 family)
MFDVALFEFEGVLFDTAAARRDALRRALADDGLPLPADSTRCAGLPVHDAVLAAAGGRLPDDTAVELAVLRAGRYFDECAAGGLALAPGAVELVHALVGRVRLGVVTRASRREADRALSLAGLDFAFACIVAAEDAVAPKPAPAPYEAAIARLGRRAPVVRDRVVALEDALPGIRSARAAGLRCIAVGGLPVHDALHADAYVPTLAALTPAELQTLVTPERVR